MLPTFVFWRIGGGRPPDGGIIAFEEDSEIYVIDANGKNVRRLTTSPGDDSHPHWSADGRRIFFNSARTTPDPTVPWSRQWIEIFSMTSDGRDIRQHSNCRTVCTYPTPSPDGRFVAYRRVDNSPGKNWDLSSAARNSEVFVGLLDGSTAVNVTNNPAFDGWPTWSPDGLWIVFASNRDLDSNIGQIYAVRADGSSMRRLTQGGLSKTQPSFNRADNRIFVSEGLETDTVEIGHLTSFPFKSSGE